MSNIRSYIRTYHVVINIIIIILYCILAPGATSVTRELHGYHYNNVNAVHVYSTTWNEDDNDM